MAESLSVNSGETYTVSSGDSETYATVDHMAGTLSVAGTLVLNGDTDIEDTEPSGKSVSPPSEINLPLHIDIYDMDMGISLFLVGILSVTLSVSYALKNYAAGIMWGIAVIALLIGGLMGMGLEIFWMAMIATVVLVIGGMVVRWSVA